MQYTQTALANMALGHIGIRNELLSNMLTDTGNIAECVRELYPLVRENVLRDYPWPFSTKTVILSREVGSEPPPNGWAYAYRYPANCAAIRRLSSGKPADSMDEKLLYEIASGYGIGVQRNVTTLASGSLDTPVYMSTQIAHGLTFGDRVLLSGFSGYEAAPLNGKYFIAVPLNTSTTFLVNETTGAVLTWTWQSTYSSGGHLKLITDRAVLYTNVADATAVVTYVLDETDANMLPDYPSDYVFAFTYALASELALRLVEDGVKLQSKLLKMYDDKLSKARAGSGNEQSFGRRPERSTFAQARN